jgi:hypothetical protein
MSRPPLNIRKIRALAGETWFARGEAYFQEGRVAKLSEHNGKLSEIVTGTQDFRVRLQVKENDLGHSCTCPLGDDEQFANTAWLWPWNVLQWRRMKPKQRNECGNPVRMTCAHSSSNRKREPHHDASARS